MNGMRCRAVKGAYHTHRCLPAPCWPQTLCESAAQNAQCSPHLTCMHKGSRTCIKHGLCSKRDREHSGCQLPIPQCSQHGNALTCKDAGDTAADSVKCFINRMLVRKGTKSQAMHKFQDSSPSSTSDVFDSGTCALDLTPASNP